MILQVNVPLMRQTELVQGVDLRDEKGEKVGKSKYAAAKGIGQVVTSRNVIMAPGMLLLPFVMQALEKKPWFAKRTALHAPFQVHFFIRSKDKGVFTKFSHNFIKVSPICKVYTSVHFLAGFGCWVFPGVHGSSGLCHFPSNLHNRNEQTPRKGQNGVRRNCSKIFQSRRKVARKTFL